MDIMKYRHNRQQHAVNESVVLSLPEYHQYADCAKNHCHQHQAKFSSYNQLAWEERFVFVSLRACLRPFAINEQADCRETEKNLTRILIGFIIQCPDACNKQYMADAASKRSKDLEADQAYGKCLRDKMCFQYLNEYSDTFGKGSNEMQHSYQSFRNCSTAICASETKRYDEWILKIKRKGLWNIGNVLPIHVSTVDVIRL